MVHLNISNGKETKETQHLLYIPSKVKSIDFKAKFDKELRPVLYNKLNEKNSIIILSDNEINKSLNINLHGRKLYENLKKATFDTIIGVSTRNLHREFSFYYKSTNIKRESDLLKLNFINVRRIINSEFRRLYNTGKPLATGIEEGTLRKLLNVNYTTENMYQRLRTLTNNSDLHVSVKREVVRNNITINEFIFRKSNINNNKNNNEKYTQVINTEVNMKDIEQINIEQNIENVEIERQKFLEEERKKELHELENVNEGILKKLLDSASKIIDIDINNDLDWLQCPTCNSVLSLSCYKCGSIISNIPENPCCPICNSELIGHCNKCNTEFKFCS